MARRPDVVNGGIGGTSARRYAGAIDGLAFPVRAGVAVLFVGTNDILRRADPLSARMAGGFAAAAGWTGAAAAGAMASADRSAAGARLATSVVPPREAGRRGGSGTSTLSVGAAADAAWA